MPSSWEMLVRTLPGDLQLRAVRKRKRQGTHDGVDPLLADPGALSEQLSVAEKGHCCRGAVDDDELPSDLVRALRGRIGRRKVPAVRTEISAEACKESKGQVRATR